MGRPLNTFLTDFIAAETGETQTTVDFTLKDGTHLRYATDNLTIYGNDFVGDLIEADDIEQSEDSGTDRVSLKIGNVLKEIGLQVKAGNINFAQGSLGLLFRRADDSYEWRENFFGVALPITVNQQQAIIEIVDEMVAAGYCVTDWTLAPKCHLIFKGNECGYTGPETFCDHLLHSDCTKYERRHRFVGGTLVLIKNTAPPVDPPTTGGGDAPIDGGGGGWINDDLCFAGETPVTLENGILYEFKFLYDHRGDFIGQQLVRSFDAENNRCNARILDVFKSTADQLAHVKFSNDEEIIRVKPNHRFWTENLEFVEVQNLNLGDRVWQDDDYPQLVELESFELVDYPEGVDVFNMTIENTAAYLAGKKRVSNSKFNRDMERGY